MTLVNPIATPEACTRPVPVPGRRVGLEWFARDWRGRRDRLPVPLASLLPAAAGFVRATVQARGTWVILVTDRRGLGRPIRAVCRDNPKGTGDPARARRFRSRVAAALYVQKAGPGGRWLYTVDRLPVPEPLTRKGDQ